MVRIETDFFPPLEDVYKYSETYKSANLSPLIGNDIKDKKPLHTQISESIKSLSFL